MSDNVLDKFLIALGFDVDKKSTQEAESSIDGIRTSALAMGGILSAAFVKTGFAVKNTADDMTNLYNQSKQLGGVGVSEQIGRRRVGKEGRRWGATCQYAGTTRARA